jgi:hypothetical protein
MIIRFVEVKMPFFEGVSWFVPLRADSLRRTVSSPDYRFLFAACGPSPPPFIPVCPALQSAEFTDIKTAMISNLLRGACAF